MKLLTAGLILALCSPLSAMAEGPETLIGQWEADCDAWGTDATCTVDWSEGLHPDHLEIAYTISPLDGGDAIFAGQGVYRIGETAIDGYWSDSGGAIHPLAASWSGDALTTHWGKAGSAQGRSRYELTETGLRVTDWSLTGEGWQQFMQVDYTRAD
ncbi:MAG: hypothetical protein RIB03_06195 [Henriciella sp.]|uniref:hypothetical protein n=1 Tax=Henriciella sp. TaxID=1968823 RepID=UPI0032EDB67B